MSDGPCPREIYTKYLANQRCANMEFSITRGWNIIRFALYTAARLDNKIFNAGLIC